mmetsp:Transcript_29970/g.57562  ORF Transcript_29970/g.57562 Transcript_29970/m.57562 type:complete len:219 (+) Transcript_29970:930-1586(+)
MAAFMSGEMSNVSLLHASGSVAASMAGRGLMLGGSRFCLPWTSHITSWMKRAHPRPSLYECSKFMASSPDLNARSCCLSYQRLSAGPHRMLWPMKDMSGTRASSRHTHSRPWSRAWREAAFPGVEASAARWRAHTSRSSLDNTVIESVAAGSAWIVASCFSSASTDTSFPSLEITSTANTLPLLTTVTVRDSGYCSMTSRPSLGVLEEANMSAKAVLH